jgi:hypothetical protein
MRRQQYFLSLIFVSLGIVIITPWWTSDTPKMAPLADKKIPMTNLTLQLPEYRKKGFDTIVQRSLFNPERRPITETPILSPGESNRAAISKVRIKGIVDNGREKMVLVEKNHKLIELNLGVKLDGWVLKKIDDSSVIFSDGKTEIDLLKTNQDAKKQTTSRNTRWSSKAGQEK